MKARVSDSMKVMASGIISFAILAFLLNRIDISGVLAVIKKCDIRIVIMAAAISISVNIFLGAYKWRRILRSLGYRLSYKEALSVRSGCLPFKIVLPFKSSEALKVLYLQKRKDIPLERGAGTILLDKGLNFTATLLLFFIGVTATGIKVPKLVPGAALLSIGLVLFSPGARAFFLNLIRPINKRWYRIAEGLLCGFDEIGIREKIPLIVYSLVYQLSEFINTYLLFKAVGIAVPFSVVLVYIPLVMIVCNLPVTVMGLGTREGLILYFFARYAAPGALLGAGLLVSLIEYILPVAVGLFFVRPLICYSTADNRAAPAPKGDAA